MRLLGQTIKEGKDTVAYNWCYMVSNLNAMSLLTGKEISDSLYRSFLEEMKSKGHNPKYGKIYTYGPQFTTVWRKQNMGDTITVSEVPLFSSRFWTNIIRKRPMVVSTNIGNQFRQDREDGVLTDMILDDKSKTGHAIVLYGLLFRDSRRDQKIYSLTRAYLTSVSGLFKYKTALEFKKA